MRIVEQSKNSRSGHDNPVAQVPSEQVLEVDVVRFIEFS
jgi:hypothetical protein